MKRLSDGCRNNNGSGTGTLMAEEHSGELMKGCRKYFWQ